MTNTLRNQLCEYLGELMYEHEHCHDWMRKDSLSEKINAVNLLIGFKSNRKTYITQVKEIIKFKKP